MGKVIAGFLAGLALGALTLVLIAREPNPTVSQAADSPAPRGTGLPATIAESGSDAESVSDDVRDSRAQPPLDDQLGAQEIAGANPQPTLAELEQRAKDADAAWLPAQEQVIKARDADHWANVRPPTQPITLPPEFDYLFEERNDTHERFQREPVDPMRSAATAVQLNRYFAALPGMTGKYGYPTINCRTTGCEIAFVVYGSADTAVSENPGHEDFSPLEFQEDNQRIFEQPWAEQFSPPPGVSRPALTAEMER